MGPVAKRIDTRQALERALDAIATWNRGFVALAATNLATGEEVARHGERCLPTASVFKLPLLVEVFRQSEAGLLDLDERVRLRPDDVVGGSGILRDLTSDLQLTLRDLATLMIVVSDNSAANMLLDRIGGPQRITATMRELGLPTIVVHRRIAFGASASGPLARAAPRDLMRLAAMLARGEVVSAAASRQILAILRRQRHLDQAPRFIAFRPHASDAAQPIEVYNKTGMSSGLRADTGLFVLRQGVTIAYSLVNDPGADETYRHEHPGDITNALIGRVLLEYWWPGKWEPEMAVYPSPYVDAMLAAAGLQSRPTSVS
jgi:beta-lactamase class A